MSRHQSSCHDYDDYIIQASTESNPIQYSCVPVGTSNQMCFALNNQFEAKELECIRIHKMSIDMHSDMIGLTVVGTNDTQ